MKNKYIRGIQTKIKMCGNGHGSSSQAEITRSICRHCYLLSARRASMSAGWRSVRPMRRRSEHKVVGRDVRGRPLKAAASVSAK